MLAGINPDSWQTVIAAIVGILAVGAAFGSAVAALRSKSSVDAKEIILLKDERIQELQARMDRLETRLIQQASHIQAAETRATRAEAQVHALQPYTAPVALQSVENRFIEFESKLIEAHTDTQVLLRELITSNSNTQVALGELANAVARLTEQVAA